MRAEDHLWAAFGDEGKQSMVNSISEEEPSRSRQCCGKSPE